MQISAVRVDGGDVRALLLSMLEGTDAHPPFEDAVADFPAFAINRRPLMAPYTPWQLLEHVRRTQHDILEYIRDPHYHELRWPRDYWPPGGAIATPAVMAGTIAGLREDLDALRGLVRDPLRDPFATIHGTPDHTLAREIRIVADHNAFHLGEFAILRAVMDTWPKGHED